MSAPNTVRYKFPLRAAKERMRRSGAGEHAEPKTPPEASTRPSKAAQTLALAHHLERLVEAGEARCVAAISRELGLTRARLSQVMQLLRLAPELQEQILTGKIHCSERRLRPVVKVAAWNRQLAIATQSQLSALTRTSAPQKTNGVEAPTCPDALEARKPPTTPHGDKHEETEL